MGGKVGPMTAGHEKTRFDTAKHRHVERPWETTVKFKCQGFQLGVVFGGFSVLQWLLESGPLL